MENKRSGFSPAALTLGIISIVANLFWYISIPTGILAIVFGVKAMKKANKGGKAGLITGIIGLALCAFIYTTMFILIFVSNY